MADDLKRDHDRIRGLLSALETMMHDDRPPTDNSLIALRQTIVEEHRRHTGRETALIEQSFGNDVIARARRYVVEQIERQATEQMRVWTRSTILTAWNGYRAETASFIRRLRAQMDDEEALIDTLYAASSACGVR